MLKRERRIEGVWHRTKRRRETHTQEQGKRGHRKAGIENKLGCQNLKRVMKGAAQNRKPQGNTDKQNRGIDDREMGTENKLGC